MPKDRSGGRKAGDERACSRCPATFVLTEAQAKNGETRCAACRAKDNAEQHEKNRDRNAEKSRIERHGAHEESHMEKPTKEEIGSALAAVIAETCTARTTTPGGEPVRCTRKVGHTEGPHRAGHGALAHRWPADTQEKRPWAISGP